MRKTRSVCPVCLKQLPAVLTKKADGIYMEKACPEHGDFSAIIWHNRIDFDLWRGNATLIAEDEMLPCPSGCKNCTEHGQGVCCTLLEVTGKCNLHCRFCFADSCDSEPSMNELKHAVDVICSHGNPLIQLSGGEPTLRDDLPELIKYIKSKGVRYVQLNSNGIRLAEDEEYAAHLKEAGLSFVFMQFDGCDDKIYRKLRGKNLFETKKKAIEVCSRLGLGVTLVPTVVKGVNDDALGDIIRFGVSLSPTVRGVHFQPVSYFGRYPDKPENSERYTLDELIDGIVSQGEIDMSTIIPSRCDHPGCGFHSSFLAAKNGMLFPLSQRKPEEEKHKTTAERNREYIGSRWERNEEAEKERLNPQKGTDTSSGGECCCSDSLDDFLRDVKTRGFTITAMAFQDAMNLDIERLHSCSLFVYENGFLKPFCARYLTPFTY